MLSLALCRLRQHLLGHLANGVCLGQRNAVKYDETRPLVRLDLYQASCPSGRVISVGDIIGDSVPGVPAFVYVVVGSPKEPLPDKKVVVCFLEMEGPLLTKQSRQGNRVRIRSLFAIVAYSYWLELLAKDSPGNSTGPMFPTIDGRIALLPLEDPPALVETLEARPRCELFCTNQNLP